MGRAMKDIAMALTPSRCWQSPTLPQVAAQAEHHWEVSKTTDGASTYVQWCALKDQKRHQAVATMLSGDNVTEEALGQAAKLIGLLLIRRTNPSPRKARMAAGFCAGL